MEYGMQEGAAPQNHRAVTMNLQPVVGEYAPEKAPMFQ